MLPVQAAVIGGHAAKEELQPRKDFLDQLWQDVILLPLLVLGQLPPRPLSFTQPFARSMKGRLLGSEILKQRHHNLTNFQTGVKTKQKRIGVENDEAFRI